MAGGIEKHVPGVELDLHLAINADGRVQVIGVKPRGDPGSHGLKSIRVLGAPQGAVLDLPGALADVVANGIAQIPPGLVVTCQAIDILSVIPRPVLRWSRVHPRDRNMKPRCKPRSPSAAHQSTT
jgi:hypothetical protein